MTSEENDSNQSSSLMYDVLGSATAGIISRVFTHPLDTVKARLQAPSSTSIISTAVPYTKFRGPFDALIQTYRYEGLRGLYGGFGAVIVGGTPGTVLYLTGYAFFRDSISSFVSNSSLSRRQGDERQQNIVALNGDEFISEKSALSQGQEFAVHFTSGMLAEAVTCIIYVPVDVVKERMQVQRNVNGQSSSNQYKGSLDALRQILRVEGMGGIYRGYGATLASFGPFSALYFMFYEKFKDWSRQSIQRERAGMILNENNDTNRSEDGDLPLTHLIACSSGAGALASWLTSPLDMAKLRLQVQRGNAAIETVSKEGALVNESIQYRGMIDCLRTTYKEGGLQGLFRGAGARVIHFAPATTITMTCYEKCRSFYANALG